MDPNQKEIVQHVLRALYIYYEAGVEGKIRVVIEREKSEYYAVLAGNHDQVKRFLTNQ